MAVPIALPIPGPDVFDLLDALDAAVDRREPEAIKLHEAVVELAVRVVPEDAVKLLKNLASAWGVYMSQVVRETQGMYR
jgi:hypothetical protein